MTIEHPRLRTKDGYGVSRDRVMFKRSKSKWLQFRFSTACLEIATYLNLNDVLEASPRKKHTPAWTVAKPSPEAAIPFADRPVSAIFIRETNGVAQLRHGTQKSHAAA